MHRNFLFITLVLICNSVASQSKVLFSENFKNNKNGWREQNDSSFSVIVKKGVLRWEKLNKNFDDRGCLWYKKEIPGFNTLQDFSITVVAKFLSGGDHTDIFDLQWGNWDKEILSKITSIYQLNFFLKGDVKLDYYNKGWNYSLRKKTHELSGDNLYHAGEYNNYEIIQKDGFIMFNINGKQFFKQFVTPIAGNAIGIQGCLKSAWEIDKIIVRQLTKTNIIETDSISSVIVPDSAMQVPDATEGNLKVFPNPFVNAFTISMQVEKSTTGSFELFDIQGNLLLKYDKKLDAGKQLIKLYADVVPGNYILKITDNSKTISTKLVKL